MVSWQITSADCRQKKAFPTFSPSFMISMRNTIKCNRFQLFNSNFAVFTQNTFIRTYVNDFTNYNAIFIELHQFALQCHRIFLEQRCIYQSTFFCVKSGFFHLVRCVVCRNNSNIVRRNNCLCSCKTYCKRAFFLKVLVVLWLALRQSMI